MSDPIVREVWISCPPERAFTGFADRIDEWWPRTHRRPGATMVLEPRVGGRFLQRLEDGVELELGTVVSWDPPRRLAYTWLPGADGIPTHVDVRFEAEGEKTRVTVVHSEGASGLGDAWPVRARRFAAAWQDVLAVWTAFMERT